MHACRSTLEDPTCNGLDDDCNGVVDDNPIDQGGPCGDVILVPGMKQHPTCFVGTLVCKKDAAGKSSLTCDGESKGVAETCNGIDDDCNGIVDDLPDGAVGGDCVPPGLPAGTKLPLLGECRPGKLFCQNGATVCLGGIGPQKEVCDDRDNDCDGQKDVNAVCANGSKCVEGNCLSPCKMGEFSCPGGQNCVNGFCEKVECAGGCDANERCDVMTGKCVPNGAGGASAGGSGGNGASGNKGGNAGTNASGGANGAGASASGGANGAGANASAGTSANSGKGGSSAAGSTGEDAQVGRKNFGLSTGGGGCSTSHGSTGDGAALALLGLAVLARSRRKRTDETPDTDSDRAAGEVSK